jgi:hypothetical protein
VLGRRWLTRAGVAVALLVVVSGALLVRRSTAARLVLPAPMNDITEQIPGYRYPTMVHGGLTFCLDKPGQVHVTSVVRSDGSLDVAGWAVHEYFGGSMAGDAVGTLAANGLARSPDPLTFGCSGNESEPSLYELLVELHATPRTTVSSGFTIRYLSDGDAGELTIPDRVIMCADPVDSLCHAT